MGRLPFVALVGVIALRVATCATTTAPVNMWVDANRHPTRVDNVLVVGLGKDETARRAFEDTLVAVLAENGTKGIASYSVLPGAAAARDAVRAAVRKGQYGGALTARVVGPDAPGPYVSGYSSSVPPADLVPFHEGWVRGWQQAAAAADPAPDKPLRVEFRVWQMTVDRDGQLVWVATSATYKPAKLGAATREICEAMVSELGKAGVI